MKIFLAWVAIWLGSFAWVAPAQAFVDPPTFVPAEPVEGQPIQMSVRRGVCHTFSATFPPRTPHRITVVGDVVEVVLSGVSEENPILCNFSIGTGQWDLAPLPAGHYTVRVRIREVFPPFTVLPAIAESSLTVRAGAPTPSVVPTTSLPGLLLLGLLTAVLGIVVMKRRGNSWLGLVAVFALWPAAETLAQQQPQWLYLELAREEAAPSPQALVDGQGHAALVGFRAVPPEAISYFVPLPFRAEGDFLAYLEAHPELARTRLEQTVVVRYPDGANLDVALAELRADPLVRHVQAVEEVEFSAGPARHPTGTRPLPPAGAVSSGQDWIDTLQLQDAWTRAGGWGLVGVIDSGLAVEHPDLRALSPTNALTGGNYLFVYAVDVGRTGLPGYTAQQALDFNPDEREPLPTLRPQDSSCDPFNTGFILASTAGHGTHVHGLIAASHANTDGTVGACKRCGLASARVAFEQCNEQAIVETVLNPTALSACRKTQ